MNNFNDRTKAFEAKFTQDADLQFKLEAKRNKLIGEWASDVLQKENKEEYVKEVRQSALAKAGDEDIIEKLMKDFASNNQALSREELLKKFNDQLIREKEESEKIIEFKKEEVIEEKKEEILENEVKKEEDERY